MSASEFTQDFVFGRPELQVSEDSFSLRIPEGDAWRSSFFAGTEEDFDIKAVVTSDHRRILLADDSIAGRRAEVFFGIDTKGLRPDDTFSGSIRICSNLGEKIIPVSVTVVQAPDEDFPDEVRALEDFEQLCRRDLREGFRLFTHPAFPRILNGKNVIYLPLYRGMSHNPVTYQHLEEFLISSGKKEPIWLSLDKQQKAVYHIDSSQKDTLYIYKDNWGYAHIDIDVYGSFIETPVKEITTDDFIGDIYGLEYIVHRDRIQDGRAYGKIVIRTVHQELSYEIEASAEAETEIRPRGVRSRRISWLMRDYLKLRLHELDYRTWQDTSALTVGEMREEDMTDTWALLYTAYLHYTHDDNAAAIETLWPVKDGTLVLESRERQALYLWLAKKTGLLPTESRRIYPALRKFYSEQPSSYLLLYLLLEEYDEGVIAPVTRLRQLEGCFEAGCSSPFLYLDAWELISKEEALLRELTPFITHVLCFGQDHGLISRGLVKRAAALSASRKEYSPSLYRLLSKGYAAAPDDDILESICQLLIKGDPMRRECFEWYARAVERSIPVTRLYEYYMETYDAPAHGTIPQDIRMYFATNHTLGDRKRALLYASVILHREEDPTGYMNYSRSMRTFALDSLKQGKIDKNYAILYQHFFAKPDTPEMARLLSKVLFVQRVTVSDKDIRRVIVCHHALKQEMAYPCRNGVAYPRIFSEDACLLFEDELHRRYASTVTCTREPLFQTRDIAQACMEQDIDDPGLELYICHEKAFQMDVNGRTEGDYRMAEQNPAFTDAYRRTVRRKLLEYDLSHSDNLDTGGIVPPEKVAAFADADKSSTAEYLIRRMRYHEAFHVISEYGFEGISAASLAELTSALIREKSGAYDEELLFLARHAAAAGKADDVVTGYLADHMDGPLDELCVLQESLGRRGMDTLGLDEKILRQMIFSGTIPAAGSRVLLDRMSRGGSTASADSVLSLYTLKDFLEQRATEDEIYDAAEEALKDGRLPMEHSALALLRHYSRTGTLSGEQRQLARALLDNMIGRGYFFDFYKDLPEDLTRRYQLEDKVFAQEQFTPDSRVIINYRIEDAGDEASGYEWISEPVRHVYGGYFVREFRLFTTQTLRYSLKVMKDGVITGTDEKTVRQRADAAGSGTRCGLIDRMLEARANGDEGALESAMREYMRLDAAAAAFLALITGRE